jgi:hypothetical protein
MMAGYRGQPAMISLHRRETGGADDRLANHNGSGMVLMLTF